MNVKTLVEVQGGRVSVQMASPGTWTFVPDEASDPLSEAREEGLRDRIHDLEADITRRVDNAGEGERQIRDLSESLARVQASRDEWREKHAEMTKQRDDGQEALILVRASREQWAQQAEQATTKLARISELVDSGASQDWPDDAIAQIRDVLTEIRDVVSE